MVVIDATTLLMLLRPGTPIPPGPGGVPIDRPKERIEQLVKDLKKSGEKITIPTPALSEALVSAGAEASQQIVATLQRFAVFQITDFDTMAALELAAMTRDAKAKGSKKGDSKSPWAKIKFDRQIVAIAKVVGASKIYSDDGDVVRIGAAAGIKVVSVAELPLPPETAQLDLLVELAQQQLSQTGGPVAEKDEETSDAEAR